MVILDLAGSKRNSAGVKLLLELELQYFICVKNVLRVPFALKAVCVAAGNTQCYFCCIQVYET